MSHFNKLTSSLLDAQLHINFNFKSRIMKNLSGLLAVLAIFLCASISYGQTNYIKTINCGDTQPGDHDGVTYNADSNNGYTFNSDGVEKILSGGHGGFTLDTNPGEIFRKTRYTKGTYFNYVFPVDDGEYTITLVFAEPYHGTGLSNQPDDYRQFDVQINGGPLEEDNLCVFCEVGKNQALVRTYQVSATGNNGITIEFAEGLVGSTRKNDPLINAIKVEGNAPANIPVTGINLSPATLDLEIGNNPVQLTHTISPSNASDPSISGWSSSNTSVASVNNGLVTPVGVGNATITVTTTNGSKTAITSVSITDPNSQPVSAGDLWLSTNNTDTYISNNVGIGTTPQTNYRLAVDGIIHTKEVLVSETGWADYVFFKNYKLPTLEEVEKHIQDKGHLINIPSAAEVEANGIELGEMNKLLLEKIEELTLYVIQQEKRIKQLEQVTLD